jgi:hypothetical protein
MYADYQLVQIDLRTLIELVSKIINCEMQRHKSLHNYLSFGATRFA